MIGKRLKLARQAAGLSQDSLVQKMDVQISKMALSKYERNLMMPSGKILRALSNALNTSIHHLMAPLDFSLGEVDFRKKSNALRSENAKVESAVLARVENYLTVENVLGLDSTIWHSPCEGKIQVDTIDDSMRAARTVRKAWNLGFDPIPFLLELLEEKGIKVVHIDNAPDSFSGMLCRVERDNEDSVPVIVTTDNKSVEHQRFTLAHELGHLVLNVNPELKEEAACNAFAGAFLAPKEVIDEYFGEKRTNIGYEEFMESKKAIGISALAILMRLKQVGIIRQSHFLSVIKGIGKTWRKEEPSPLKQREYPRRFDRLCQRAAAEGNISNSRAAELLDISVMEVRKIIAGPKEKSAK